MVCTKPYLAANAPQESAVWNAVNGEELLECLNNNFGCFIAEFLDFKLPGVIVCDNEVDFPVPLKQISGNPFPWTRKK